MTVHFTIPYPQTKKGKSNFCKRFGLNAYYAGKAWPVRKRDAEELHKMTTVALHNCRVRRRLFEEPVTVVFTWDDGLDCDNHAVLGKAILDACKGWVIADDNRRHVRSVVHLMQNDGQIGVTITDEKVTV